MKTKKRQCTKGYSCGISCIAVTRACRKEFPAGVSVRLDSRQVERGAKNSPASDPVTTKAAELRAKRNEAFVSGDWTTADLLTLELDALLTATPPRLEGEPPLTPTTRKQPSEAYLDEIKNKLYSVKSDNSKAYDELGYHAKPDLVESRADLYQHDGLLKGEDGLPMVFYRGTDSFDHHEELRTGDKHFVGFGVFGNGTYAAGSDRQSQELTASHTASTYGSARVAFGIKADAKVFKGDIDTEAQRIADSLGLNTKNIDYGIIMALGGYDAYVASKDFTPFGEWDKGLGYYVVLNRSAMVISKENISEL